MRCYCCGKALNDYESTLKSVSTNEYLDTCVKCLEGLGIETIGRSDLSMYDEAPDDHELNEEYEEWDE